MGLGFFLNHVQIFKMFGFYSWLGVGFGGILIFEERCVFRLFLAHFMVFSPFMNFALIFVKIENMLSSAQLDSHLLGCTSDGAFIFED